MVIMGGFLSDFLDSSLFQNVIFPLIVFVVIFYVLSWLMFKKAPGVVIQEFMGNRPISLEDVDAQVHARILDACDKSCRLSDDRNVRYLWIKALDNIHYTHNSGRKFVGHVKGLARSQTFIMVKFKKRAWGFRKYYFVAPPDLLIGSSSARNIMFEGTSVRNLESAVDFCYPIPSSNPKWNENRMDEFAIIDFYETRRVKASAMMYTQIGETTGLQAASSTAQERAIRDALRTHQFRQEVPPVDQTSQEPSWIAE